jgi:hypothetical protein
VEADTGSMEPEKRGRALDRREGPPIFVRPRDGTATGLIRVDVRSLTFFAVLLALIGLGGWLYLQQASEVAALAHEIRVLERDKERLHLEITALRGEVAMLGSLGRVLEAGTQLGYTMPDTFDRQRRLRVVYEPLPTPTEEPAAPVATDGEPASGQAFPGDRAPGLVQRLVDQLRAWIAAPVEDGGPEPSTESARQP